jgi:hypothetical protein
MKILADTCIWSLALRRRPLAPLAPSQQQGLTALTEAIRNNRLAIFGPIRQELLSGIKDFKQFERVRAHLERFPDEQLQTIDFEEAARNDNLCRSRGIACGPVDMLICAVALQRRWPVLTLDQGLTRCLQALGGAAFVR